MTDGASSGDSSARVALVPQPHGGALQRGNPGNEGGRPPSELRRRMRGALDARLHIAEEIADDPKASAADRLRALEFFAKHAFGRDLTVEEALERMRQTIVVIREELDDEAAERVLARIRPIWR